jgi:predicted AAA+ superfamily ATPase
MSAANQYVNSNEITSTTYEQYLQLFFGDVARLKRDEGTAKKVLSAILNHPHSAVGWDRLSNEAGIPSAPTVMQYAEVLKNLFVVNIYNGLDQNRKQPKQRSEKKFQITNPFFFHAFHGYLSNPAGDFFQQAKAFLSDSSGKAALAEFMVGDHITRLAYNFSPSDMFDQENFVFYVRNSAGESVDFMVRLADGFVPIEVSSRTRSIPATSRTSKNSKGAYWSRRIILNWEHPILPYRFRCFCFLSDLPLNPPSLP